MSTLALQDNVAGLHNDADAYREGREALDRLSRARDWSDWKKVGAALAAGRTEAMRTAKANEPKGKKYNQAFGDVLKREHLDRIDSATRNQLLQIAEKLPEIEAWREKLDPVRHLKLNHPSAIWRNWRRTVKGAGKKHADEVEQSAGDGEDAGLGPAIAALTMLVQQMRQRGFANAQLDDLLAAEVSFDSNDLRELVALLGQLATAWQERAKNPCNTMIEEASR
jgi:hypothetical protein